MNASVFDLHDLVRQLRAELEWATRTGIVIEAPRAIPEAPKAEPLPKRLKSDGSEVPAPPPLPAMDPAAAPMASPSPTAAPPVVESEASGELARCGTLSEIRDALGDCTRCKLHGLGRSKIVFGVGNPEADVMFVGEGPGGEEDRQGEPFVGAAGQLLTRIIEGGMGMKRSDVYIANIVKCRPPKNRDPEPDEVAACEPFLKAQIRVIKPKVIVALGRYAAHALLRTDTPIRRLRGKWMDYEGTPLMPTFHPAYLLRNPAEKRPVWEDIQEVLKFLGRNIPERKGDQS